MVPRDLSEVKERRIGKSPTSAICRFGHFSWHFNQHLIFYGCSWEFKFGDIKANF